MFSLSVIAGPTVWMFAYNKLDTAEEVFKALEQAVTDSRAVMVSDDYGHRAMLRPTAVLLEDLNKSKMAHVGRMIHDAEIRSLAVKQAQTNPALRSPTVASPMFSGGMPPVGPNGFGRG